VTTAVLLVSQEHGGSEAFTISEDPLRLRSARLSADVHLQLQHQYQLVREKARRSWHASTAAYAYTLTSSGRELAAWHWHPASGVAYPHVHVTGAVLDHRVHVPTGRVSIESVLRMLIGDFGVAPLRDDWDDVLAKTERDFIEHRRWHA